MNKLMICVKSCNAHMEAGYHAVLRETWAKDFPANTVKFFVGRGVGKNLPDEVRLDCDDDYNSLPFKTQAICGWAASKVLDHLFICDTDTFVNAKALLACGYENFDYSGKIDKAFGETFPYVTVSREGVTQFHAKAYGWASGGYGYFLSRKAYLKVAYSNPIGWAEDFLVGQQLNPLYNTGEIKMLNIPGGSVSDHFPAHLYKSGYDLKFNWMPEKYAESKR
jgi:hypothetical protein